MGCGLFQIVPELEPDTRCDCVRCGTTLRRSRRDPLSRGLALNFAALLLFTIVWTAMLMKVHPSNYAVVGFTNVVPEKEIACFRLIWTRNCLTKYTAPAL